MTDRPDPAPEAAPDPAVPPREPAPPRALDDVLAGLRRRSLLVHGTAAALALAGVLALLVLAAAVALGLGAPVWLRGIAFAAAAGLAVVAAGWAFRRIAATSDAELAEALERADPDAAGLATAVSLRDELPQLEAEAPEKRAFSPELARAHVEAAAHRAFLLDPRRAFDLRPVKRVAAGAGGAVLALAVVALLSDAASPGLGRLARGDARAEATGGDPRAEPITSEVKLTYLYPAYTGLPTKVVEGTAGDIAAPKGTEVRLETRADREVAKAFVEVDGASLPLQVTGGRDLAGTISVQKSGSYAFRFEDARGRVLAVGPPIPIVAAEDGAPQVKLLAPVAELVVGERDRVELAWEASDDYGVAKLELVFKVGGGDEEVAPIGTLDRTPRRADGKHPWELAPLGLRPGDVVTYYVRAFDADGVQGGKHGVSRTQTLKVFSEAEHRRELVARVEKAWEKMVVALGDRITPREGPQAVEGAQRIPAGRPADEQVAEVVGELKELGAALRKDEKAPRELAVAAVNIATGLDGKTRLTRQVRHSAQQRAAVGDLGALPRLDAAEGAEQKELENDVLYLEALLDRQKLEEMRELAREMSDSRRELARLLEQYKQEASDPVKRRIQQEIARLKARMAELMKKMAELGKSIQDEHLNAEAMKQLAEQKDMMGELDELQKLLAEGKIDEAMQKLQELGMQLDEMEKDLEKAQDGQTEQSPEMKELAEQLKKFQDELSDLKETEEQLAKRTEELKRDYQRQIQKELAEKGQKAVDELRAKVEKAREKLADVPEGFTSFSQRENALDGAKERLEDLDHALAAKDFDAARESAESALMYEQSVTGDLERELEYGSAFRGRPEPGLAEANRNAREAERLTAEVKKELDELFPDPSEKMSGAQKQQMEQMAREQRQLRERMQALREQAAKIGEKAPIFDQDAERAMAGAQGSMEDASGRLGGRDPGGALASERRALEQLQGLEDAMEQAMQRARKNGTGKGFPLPLAMRGGRGSEDGIDGEMNPDEKVLIPGADQYKVPEEFRRDILEAMKQGAPDAFREHVKEYYEEIVK